MDEKPHADVVITKHFFTREPIATVRITVDGKSYGTFLPGDHCFLKDPEALDTYMLTVARKHGARVDDRGWL